MLGYDCWLSAAEALRVPHRKGLGKNRRFGTSDSRLGRYHTVHSAHNVGALTEKSFTNSRSQRLGEGRHFSAANQSIRVDHRMSDDIGALMEKSFYQEAFLTPGIWPLYASSRKQIRQMP